MIYGSSSATTLLSLLCVRAQLVNQLGGLNSNFVFIDGGNNFNLYQISKLARALSLDAKKTLDNIYISMAFTAYQLTALIMQRLKQAVAKFNAKLVIVSDVAGYFTDKDLSDDEAQRVFSQTLTYLSDFARQKHVVLVTTLLPRKSQEHNDDLSMLAQSKASIVLSLRKTKYTREVALEKHPYLTLKSVELPSNIVRLSDFVEAC